MKAVILAAGYGTRLKKIAKDTPKPLLPVNGKPLLDYILQNLEGIEGLNEIIVVTNDKFFDHFQSWSDAKDYPVKITIVNDGTKTPDDRLGSIGDIHFVIQNQQPDEDVIVIGGDNLFNFNLADYMKFAQSKGDCVSIGAYDINDRDEAKLFGVLSLDDTGKVTSFEEKPEEPKATLVAMCFYYLPRETLPWVGEYLNQTEKSDLAGDYIRWLTQKSDVYGFKFEGKWYDIGSVEAYEEASKHFST